MRHLSFAAAVLVLAACGRVPTAPGEPAPTGDPLVAEALNEPLGTDPELAAQNRANAVVSLPAPDGSLPSLDIGAEAADRARADALSLLGAGQLREAPPASSTEAPLAPEARLTAAALAAALPATASCAGSLEYSAAWAARLPRWFPVYPRGAVQEAAGTDRGGCALRVVNFQTPVAPGEVIDFYYSRARAAGFFTRHVMRGSDDVLYGSKASAAYTVLVRPLAAGATEIDLVTRG